MDWSPKLLSAFADIIRDKPTVRYYHLKNQTSDLLVFTKLNPAKFNWERPIIFNLSTPLSEQVKQDAINLFQKEGYDFEFRPAANSSESFARSSFFHTRESRLEKLQYYLNLPEQRLAARAMPQPVPA